MNYFRVPQPSVKHIILQSERLLSKIILVGDIHGCLVEFQELLNKCNYDRNDTSLILLGDLVNKGPYSAEVVKMARELDAFCVRGNHEESLLSYAFNMNDKPRPAYYDYIDKLDSLDLNWLKDLPYTLSIPSLDCLVVHAGLVPGRPLEEQAPGDMHSMRNLVPEEEEPLTPGPGSFKATSSPLTGVAWASMWSDGPHVYFGHDAKRGLQQFPLATGLDTGCCYGRKLSAMVLPAREIVQVQAHRVYEEPKGSD